jgi:hypothetical protein
VLAPARPVIGHPLVVLVDDAHTFRDGRAHVHAQTSTEAIRLVSSLAAKWRPACRAAAGARPVRLNRIMLGWNTSVFRLEPRLWQLAVEFL